MLFFFSTVKNENFITIILIFFNSFQQNINIVCTSWSRLLGGSSNDYSPSMFWIKNKICFSCKCECVNFQSLKLGFMLIDVLILVHVRGLGFKFVDFLYKSSDVWFVEIKNISSENTFVYLSYEILSIVLLSMVSAQQLIKNNDPPSAGARCGNF